MRELSWLSHPAKGIRGCITVPGDKSISHRALILGAIARGATTIVGFLDSDDCWATLKALQVMGVSIEHSARGELIVHGVGKYGLKQPSTWINCGNSGTAMRLLTGLLSGQNFASQLDGDESLRKRPMTRISQPLTQMGANIITEQGFAPIQIGVSSSLRGISYKMEQASAQVKSCLLLAALYAKGETEIIEPWQTRDHTERMLNSFSYPLKKIKNTLILSSEAEGIATQITIPGDLSSAAFFIVAATLVPSSKLIIKDVGVNPTRMGVIHILQNMGAHIEFFNTKYHGNEQVADIYIQYAPLKAVEITSAWVPLAIDEFPIIFVAAACAKGQTVIRGLKELRLKESDRIYSMMQGLQALGIEVKNVADDLFIEGGELRGGEVYSYQDHRVAMAFAVAGAIAKEKVLVKGCDNVSTSFPNFFHVANKINMAVQEKRDES